jgi:hypothetical protein
MSWFFWFALFLAWYIIGLYSFIYWERTNEDIMYSDIPHMLVISAFGPITFFIGMSIYAKHKVFIKKKAGIFTKENGENND